MQRDLDMVTEHGSYTVKQPSCAAPLYVDMDGTLLNTDALWELLALLVRTKPALIWLIPFWLLRGKAFIKHQLVSHVMLNASILPYNKAVITFLSQERERGRTIILATAADRLVAESVARHVGLFSGVLASDGAVNLSGTAKLAAILE